MGYGARKIERAADPGGCPVRQGPDEVWQVRGYAEARAVLRSTDNPAAGAVPGRPRAP